MSDHFLKTIEALEAKMAERDTEHARWKFKTQSTINELCDLADLPPKYDLSAGEPGAAPSSGAGIGAIRPDEYYGKPLATAVKMALTHLKSVNRAPASIETIYEVLHSGGFDFPNRARDAAIQGLSVSIGKNSDSFVKLQSGLIGVREWYGTTPKRKANSKTGGADEDDGEKPAVTPASGDEPNGSTPTN